MINQAVRRALDGARVTYHSTPHGRTIHIYCPFHMDRKTASCVIYVDKEQPTWFCFGCLEEHEPLWTREGLQEIGEVPVGMQVLTHRGYYETVVAKQTQHNKKVIGVTLRSFNVPLFLTPDHTCLRIPREKATSLPGVAPDKTKSLGFRYSGKRADRIRQAEAEHDYKWLKKYTTKPEIEEVAASKLKEGDFVLFPVIADDARQYSTLSAAPVLKKYTKGPRTKRLPGLPVTEGLAWLYGLWLAEGSLGRGVVRFTCSLAEGTTLLARAQKVVETELQLPAQITLYPEKNTSELFVCKTDLAAQLHHWFGSGASRKRLPGEVLRWPKNLQQRLLEGYLEGDGSQKRQVVSTVSRKLAYGIYALAIQAGLFPYLTSKREHRDGKGVWHRKSWLLSFLHRGKRKGRLGSQYCYIDGVSYFVTYVKTIRSVRKKKTVVDITVQGDSTFVTKSCAVHNCGARGDWKSLADALKLQADLPRYWDDPLAGKRLHDQLKRISKDPAIPPYTREWVAGSWRGIRPYTLQAVHSLWWWDELDSVRRILWPIWDRDSSLIGWSGRKIDEKEDVPKYRHAPRMEVTTVLWPLPRTSSRETVAVIVEGAVDSLRLLQQGIPALCNFGTIWSPARTAQLLSLGIRRVIIALDGDDAGRNGNALIAKHLRNNFDVGFWLWPDETDPGSAPAHEVGSLRRMLRRPLLPHRWLSHLPRLSEDWKGDPP